MDRSPLLSSDSPDPTERLFADMDARFHAEHVKRDAAIEAQRLSAALVYAITDEERALVRRVYAVIHAQGVSLAYRVTGVVGGAVHVFATGNPKLRHTDERDAAMRLLTAAGLAVTLNGSWHLEVRAVVDVASATGEAA